MSKYKGKRRLLNSIKINTLQELAIRLGVEIDVLEKVASDIHKYCNKKTEIDKKGKERIVYPPSKKLRGIQKVIQEELLDRIVYPPTFHGGLKGLSTRTNAEPHVGQAMVAEFDIKNFFPSVSHKRIYKMFVSQECAPDVARLLTQLTTVDGHMAQGFLTSPKLSVLTLLPIDRRLTKLFNKHGLVHTIWIDNFTVSGSFRINKLESTIRKIFSDNGFILKEASYLYRNERQTVTGATVNDKVMPPRKTVNSLRKTKYIITKYGTGAYLKKYAPNTSASQLKILITGKLSYLLSLNKEKYLSLHKWFQDNIKT